MPILDLGSAWFLQSPNATYALGINAEGYLEHWHWGPQLRPTDLGALRPWIGRSFSVGLPTDTAPDLGRSLETLLAEYPFPGSGDFRPPALEVEHADGTRVLRLRYVAHRISAGKPPLTGLPATYVEAPAEADTLEIDLRDELSAVQVTLQYTVFSQHDAIARSARVVNAGTAAFRLTRALSASVDLGERADWRWLHLSGAWARERQQAIAPLRPGTQTIASSRGASSHQHNPFLALLAPEAGEEHGEVYGFSLVYSGNFLAGIELDPDGIARCQIGLNPSGFAWLLEPGESFQAPEAVLVFSGHGLGGMSRTYHALYRTRLCRGRYRDEARPVLINNWEATYFDFDPPKLLALAKAARSIGVELFVLDDGWFGRRDNDRSSLGDWQVHAAKLPGGLNQLAAAINGEGLQFGLWFEPEMISPDSDLFRQHPDWCLAVPGRSQSLGRHQLVLDFSRPEVRDAIYAQIAQVLRSAPIRFVKWDMNRHWSEVASTGRTPARQAETAHRHVLGLYAMLERLSREFPDLLLESCSGGGGRCDPGMLFYMPQVWISDNTDAISRLRIQYGTSLVYPLSAMSAHISAVPNHQNGRVTPLNTRGIVAMMGAFGLELDLDRCSPAELAEIQRFVTQFQAWRSLIAHGQLYRLKSPFDGNEAAWMVVANDRRSAVVFHVLTLTEANAGRSRLRLRGLDPDQNYRDEATGAVLGGDALMAHGWLIENRSDFQARSWHLSAC